MKETKLQQTIGVIKNLFRTIKQRLLFLLAGSLKMTDVVTNKFRIMNLISSMIICQILTNNWFISIVSSIIVSILFILLGLFIRWNINNEKIIKIHSNDCDIKISEINDDTNINLTVVLEDVNQNKIRIKDVNCKLKILFSDGYKNQITPNIMLINKQIGDYIDFSIDGEILVFEIKFKTCELNKIGIVWYKFISEILITTQKDKTKLIHVDLSDKLLKLFQNENGVPNLDNLKHFIDFNHISNVINESEKYNNDVIIEKSIIENPRLLDYRDEENYPLNNDQYELDDDGQIVDK